MTRFEPQDVHHRAQEAKRTVMSDLISGFATLHALGAVVPALVALFLLYLALGDLLHGRLTREPGELGVGAVFGPIAWMQARVVWVQPARFRIPPQSDVTIAFDFSDDTPSVLEQARFICTVRNRDFAQAFRMLNLERE